MHVLEQKIAEAEVPESNSASSEALIDLRVILYWKQGKSGKQCVKKPCHEISTHFCGQNTLQYLKATYK